MSLTFSLILFITTKATNSYEIVRSSHPEVFCKKSVLRIFPKFTGKHLCQSLFFNKAAGLRPATLLKKETLAQVFSCEFCKIPKNNFSYSTPLVAAFASHATALFQDTH